MKDRGKSVGIIGGGLLGMTLAYRFAQSGHQVTVLEAGERLGGLAVPMTIGEYTWDSYYHVVLLSDFHTLGLLRELGIEDRVRWSQTKTGFFTDGRLHSMSNSLEFLMFPPLGLLDKLRLGWTIFYASKIRSWKRLEHVLVADWLARLSGEKTFNKIWLPLLKSKLGDRYVLVNASFIWATIARMYAARRTGLKQEQFGYVDGGYGTVLDRFEARLEEADVEICRKTTVASLMGNGKDIAVCLPSGETMRYDAVVLTVPGDQVAKLCLQLSQSEKDRLSGVSYLGVVCAALIVKRPLSKFYVTNITDGWAPFTGVIEMTALVDREYFGGNSLVYLPRYASHDDPVWKAGDEVIVKESVEALERMYPGFKASDVVSSAVARSTHVMPLTTLNYSEELLPPTATSLKGVFVANSAQIANGTMNVNEIVGLGNSRAAEICDILR